MRNACLQLKSFGRGCAAAWEQVAGSADAARVLQRESKLEKLQRRVPTFRGSPFREETYKSYVVLFLISASIAIFCDGRRERSSRLLRETHDLFKVMVKRLTLEE